MSNAVTLPQVTALAAQLPPAERRQLAETILRELDADVPPAARRRSWREIRGSVPYPLCDEDAQDWVSRSRQESDDHREPQGRSHRSESR
jgi:hypothetical protein